MDRFVTGAASFLVAVLISASASAVLVEIDTTASGFIIEDILDGTTSNGSLFDSWYAGPVEGGTLYGEGKATEGDEGMDVLVLFDLDGVAVVEGTLGSSILFGGALLSVDHLGELDDMRDDIGEGIFHHTHPYGILGPETPAPKLILEIIPEPSTGVLLVGACGLLAARRQRRRSA